MRATALNVDSFRKTGSLLDYVTRRASVELLFGTSTIRK
jgi:hypothetical protein